MTPPTGFIVLALGLVLSAVFALYLDADFLRTLANQIWGCF